MNVNDATPPFDAQSNGKPSNSSGLVSDVSSDLVDSDPTHRVGQLDRAKKKPLSVPPDTPVLKATTLMMTHGFSQLPVMVSNRRVKGVFSWKSLAHRLTFEKRPVTVKEAMETAVIIGTRRSLFEAARIVADSDYVLIQDEDGSICGILTASDLSLTFSDRSEPFLLLEQIEKQLRNRIKGKVSQDEIRAVLRFTVDAAVAGEIHRLGLGDYIRLFKQGEIWKKIGLFVDQEIFVKKLEEVKSIRNTVMHFNPNGLVSQDVSILREFASFMRQIQHAME
jgi:CBS domain-containing protein